MDNIINFALERAKRKSGIKDIALLKDIIDEGYDPCNPLDMTNYFEWKKFQNIIINDADIQDNWSDEAIDRLWKDLKTFDDEPRCTVCVEYNDNDDLNFTIPE